MLSAFIFICVIGSSVCDEPHSIWMGEATEHFVTSDECQSGAIDYLHTVDFGNILKAGQQYQIQVNCIEDRV